MPIYEYRCDDCGQAFEYLARSMSSTEPVSCPKCGGLRVKRQLSVFAARQQGDGESCCGLAPGSSQCGQCPGLRNCVP